MHDRDATLDESYLRVTMLFNLVFTSLSDQLLNVCVLVIHFQPEKKVCAKSYCGYWLQSTQNIHFVVFIRKSNLLR